MFDPIQHNTAELTDTAGAVKVLADRFHLPGYTAESVRQLVKNNRLRCLIFRDGVLVERQHSENTRGQDLLFLRSDLEELEQPRRGRRWK